MDYLGGGGVGCARLITPLLFVSFQIASVRKTHALSLAHNALLRVEDLFCCGRRPRVADRFLLSFPWCELHIPRG
jgi:hypothetical protein